MSIVVSQYDHNWKIRFEELKKEIYPEVASHCLSIEHVGSTSVEGLAAKPILDVDIIIKSKADLPPIIKSLQNLGYEHRGDLGIEGREAFRCLKPKFPHHLYVCLEGCTALQNHLLLREHLRSNKTDRDHYSKLKMELAQKHHDDIDSYIDGKTDFILEILAKYDLDENQLEDIEIANRK